MRYRVIYPFKIKFLNDYNDSWTEPVHLMTEGEICTLVQKELVMGTFTLGTFAYHEYRFMLAGKDINYYLHRIPYNYNQLWLSLNDSI